MITLYIFLAAIIITIIRVRIVIKRNKAYIIAKEAKNAKENVKDSLIRAIGDKKIKCADIKVFLKSDGEEMEIYSFSLPINYTDKDLIRFYEDLELCKYNLSSKFDASYVWLNDGKMLKCVLRGTKKELWIYEPTKEIPEFLNTYKEIENKKARLRNNKNQ